MQPATEEHTRRFQSYARAHGVTPEAMLAMDRTAFPGGCMAGFIAWVAQRWSAWDASRGQKDARYRTDAEQEAFDAWLEASAAE